MVCTANDLLEWKDFPKGLRILLLDEDINSASEIKLKLEEMEYIVYAFVDEQEALSAILSKSESFHVAIVEVSIHNNNGRCKFLESAKDLPTIMTSKEHCLSTMMKCIALGAVEFLVKPLSEDKLRNIWQHVVHKAFNAGRNSTSESLKSIKEFVGSVMEIQQQNISQNHNQSSVSDGDSQDQTDMIFPVKSVDTTYHSVVKMEIDQVEIKDEDDHGDASKGTTDNSSPLSDDSNKQDAIDLATDTGNSLKVSTPQDVCGAKGNRKKAKFMKIKVDWTPELHKKFVQVVEKLGVDQAIPSRILELMKVEGLTRHNIASHLQKYRMQIRHILPKEDNRWNYYPHVMAFPPYHTNHTLPLGQVYPHFPMWTPPTYPSWQQAETWHWKPYPGMHADAWGCPVMPPSPCPSSTFPPGAYGFHSPDHYGKISTDLHHLGEETVDKAVKEAISKPWLPLPIGLKPPSIDSVLAELSRQGISTVPPHINGHRSL